MTETGTYFDYETIAEGTPTYDGLERGIFEHSVKVKSMYMLALSFTRMNTRRKGVESGETVAGGRFNNRTLPQQIWGRGRQYGEQGVYRVERMKR